MNTTETTYTCPETGVTIHATGLAGKYGDARSEVAPEYTAGVTILRRGGADAWRIVSDDVYAGDMTPMDEANGIDIVIPLWAGKAIVIRDSDVPEILQAGAKLCTKLRQITEGYSVEWDGQRYVGKFSDKADAAWHDVENDEQLCTAIACCGEDVWDAGEWFYESLDELDVEALRDSGLKERLLEEAERDRARLVGSVQDAIDEAIADREDADADESTPRVTQGARLDAGAVPD